MNKIIKGLMFILAVGFSGLSSASTINFFAYGADGSDVNDAGIGIPPSQNIIIGYDSSNWASINSATLSVKMVDDSSGLLPLFEYADITSINGGADPGVTSVEVAFWSDWYWDIDVSSFLTLGMASSTLDFDLVSNSYGWFGSIGDYVFHNARLSVDYNAIPNAVPVPAALFLFAPALLGFLGLRRKAQA